MTIHRIKFRRLHCADQSGFFSLRFPPKCRIVRIGFAQSEEGGAASACTLTIWSSPDANREIVGSSTVPEVTPENERVNPALYRVTDPISITAGGVHHYVAADGGGIPYIDDGVKLDAKDKGIYLQLAPAVGNTYWDILFDVERL